MKTRILLTFVLCCAVCALTLSPRSVTAKDFGIGSKAPPLDIEHWIQDGNGFFKQVKEFESGKVYVVEFWATWCGPCISSMPHLAELQNKYRGRDVQIISVSDETVDEVQDLLDKDNEQAGKTFAEVTSAYSLTTDPDGSVYKDYMDASNQQGIPTSFIVGKTGIIEWIGHPMELDEPLEAVVTDAWDREKFKAELKVQEEFKENMERISMLAGAGKFDDALKLVDSQIEKVDAEPMRHHWLAVRNGLKLSAGLLDDEVLAFYRAQLKEMKGDAYAIGRFGYSMFGAVQQGSKIGPLADDVIAAIEAETGAAEAELKPLLFNTIALLSDVTGKTENAIKAQQAAIDAADARQKRRLTPFLEELKGRQSRRQSRGQGRGQGRGVSGLSRSVLLARLGDLTR